jgi:hypothetical protein
LEVADEMPARFAGTMGNFCFGFLDLILAKKNLAGLNGFADGLRGARFGNCQEQDGLRITPGAGTGRANPLLNCGKVIGKAHDVIVNRKPQIVNELLAGQIRT